jgi:hypothetical protein
MNDSKTMRDPTATSRANAVEKRVPKFRLIVATMMVVFIGWAIISAGMAAMLGLRQLSDSPARSAASSGLLDWLENSLNPYAFTVLLSSSLATIVFAFLLRKVVLNGLRER